MTARTAEKRDQVKRVVLDMIAKEPHAWPLPTYAALCATTGAAQGTIACALDELVEEEHITKRGKVYLKGAPSEVARVARLAVGRHSVGDLMGLRLCLETGAADLAARGIREGSSIWRSRLLNLLQKIESNSATTRVGTLEALDWEIHDTILQATDNKAICEVGGKLHIVLEGCVQTNVRTMGHDADYRRATHEQHKRILTAIIHGAADLAVEAVKKHLNYAMNRLGPHRLAQPVS